MAKIKGSVSAIYMQTSAVSQAATGTAMSRVGATLWYIVTSATKAYWDKAHTVTVYDGVTEITPLEIDYANGAVRLSAAASGSVTADHYYFAVSQVGGFRSHSIDESMELADSGTYEDPQEVTAMRHGATGQAEGFFSTVDSSLTTAKGSNKDLTFTSRLLGVAGDGISVESVVSGNGTLLSVAVATLKITITSATDGSGNATSTARQIRDALEASEDVMALIKVKLATGSDGSGIFGALTEANLAGGVDFAGDRFGEDLIGVFYWDSGASLIQTSGIIQLEKVSIKTSVKELVGKTINFKFVGGCYDQAG